MGFQLEKLIMKEYEYIGVMCSVVAYYLIVTGSLTMGFTIGIIASSSLIIYFTTIESLASIALQSFFVCANMYGLTQLG